MTQNQEILNHLKTKPITPIEALIEYGCFRLASRINQLRKKHKIKTKYVTKGGKRFAEYRLEG